MVRDIRTRVQRLEGRTAPRWRHLVSDLGGGWVELYGKRMRRKDLPAGADYTIIREVVCGEGD